MNKVVLTPVVTLTEKKQASNVRFPVATEFSVALNGMRVIKGTLPLAPRKVTEDKILSWLKRGQLTGTKGSGYQLAKDAGLAA